MIQGDHEDAPGQIELNFGFDRAEQTADNLSTFRQICKQVGREVDAFPCFMPKPFVGVSANGCHHNISPLTFRSPVLRIRCFGRERLAGGIRGPGVRPFAAASNYRPQFMAFRVISTNILTLLQVQRGAVARANIGHAFPCA